LLACWIQEFRGQYTYLPKTNLLPEFFGYQHIAENDNQSSVHSWPKDDSGVANLSVSFGESRRSELNFQGLLTTLSSRPEFQIICKITYLLIVVTKNGRVAFMDTGDARKPGLP